MLDLSEKFVGLVVIISLSTMSYLEEGNSGRQIFCLELLIYSKIL